MNPSDSQDESFPRIKFGFFSCLEFSNHYLPRFHIKHIETLSGRNNDLESDILLSLIGHLNLITLIEDSRFTVLLFCVIPLKYGPTCMFTSSDSSPLNLFVPQVCRPSTAMPSFLPTTSPKCPSEAASRFTVIGLESR